MHVHISPTTRRCLILGSLLYLIVVMVHAGCCTAECKFHFVRFSICITLTRVRRIYWNGVKYSTVALIRAVQLGRLYAALQ